MVDKRYATIYSPPCPAPPRLHISLEEAPTVALLGARQVGKTTLAQQVAAAWPGQSTVFDLEVAAVREALSQTPEALLRNSEGLTVIDEVQRLPALFQLLRPVCDDPNRKAVFLLLGSASWDLVQGISETLAGRDSIRGCGGLLVGRGGAGAPRQALDARRLSACMAGAIRRRRGSGGCSRFRARFWSGTFRGWVPRYRRKHWAASGACWRTTNGQTWNAAELGRSMDVRATAVNHYRDLPSGYLYDSCVAAVV